MDEHLNYDSPKLGQNPSVTFFSISTRKIPYQIECSGNVLYIYSNGSHFVVILFQFGTSFDLFKSALWNMEGQEGKKLKTKRQRSKK